MPKLPNPPLASLLIALALAAGCPEDQGSGATDSDAAEATTGDGETTTATTAAATTGFPTTGDGATSGAEERICVAAGPGSAPVQACNVDFCPPATWLVEARDAGGGVGLVYEGGYPGFEIYKYQTAEEKITLRFDAKPAADATDAWLIENLLSLSLNIDYPFPDATFLGGMSTRLHSDSDPWLLDTITFAGGRFMMNTTSDLTEAIQEVWSSEEACTDDDIAGRCDCQYDGFTISTTFVIDLTLSD